VAWILATAARFNGSVRPGAGFRFGTWEDARGFRRALADASIPARPVRFTPRGFIVVV
jgi:hypothetical protein